MVFAFLSARLRRWLLLAVVVPLGGRALQALGPRVPGRAGSGLTRAGDWLRGPQTDPGRRRGRRYRL